MNNLLNIYLRSKRFRATPHLHEFAKTKSLDKYAIDAVIWQFWNRRQNVKIYVAWVLKSRGFIMFYFLLYKSPELYMFIDSAPNSN